MARKLKLEYEMQLSAEQAAALLERVAAGIRGGEIALGEGETAFRLPVGRQFKVEVEAKADRRGGELELELSWQEGAATPSPDPRGFGVMAQPPVPLHGRARELELEGVGPVHPGLQGRLPAAGAP